MGRPKKVTEKEFTKGPWSIRHYDCGSIAIDGPNDFREHPVKMKIPVCNMVANEVYKVKRREVLANARLIAAAPEMFELLWQISGALEGCKYEDAISVDLEHKINAIIANVLGEESKP